MPLYITGQEPGVGGSRNRVGQISHSVVLGTFNVGEQGEGTMPDLNRVGGLLLFPVNFVMYVVCYLVSIEQAFCLLVFLGYWGCIKLFWNWEPAWHPT